MIRDIVTSRLCNRRKMEAISFGLQTLMRTAIQIGTFLLEWRSMSLVVGPLRFGLRSCNVIAICGCYGFHYCRRVCAYGSFRALTERNKACLRLAS
jgi:hypothetical protein